MVARGSPAEARPASMTANRSAAAPRVIATPPRRVSNRPAPPARTLPPAHIPEPASDRICRTCYQQTQRLYE